jgi:hypothetical protein
VNSTENALTLNVKISDEAQPVIDLLKEFIQNRKDQFPVPV